MKGMFNMQAFVCLLAVLFSACSHAVEVPALPQSEFADTEVSTNFTFAVGAVANRRLVFTLELQASPSNNDEAEADRLRVELLGLVAQA